MQRLEYFLVVVLGLFVLLLSFYPIYYRYKTTPPDRTYVGTTFYTADYAGYVSTIEQGIKGKWTYSDKFTTEKVPDTFLYYPYLILGYLGGFFGLSSIWIYHLSRFFLGALYLGCIYWLIRIVFPDSEPVIPAKAGIQNKLNRFPIRSGMTNSLKRLVAFILVLFSSSWPVISNGALGISSLSRAVAEVQVFNRFVIQPHFLLGNIFLILGLILFLKYLEKPQIKYALISGVLAFLTAIFRPSHVMLYIATIGLYFLITYILSLRVSRSETWQSQQKNRLLRHPSTSSGFLAMTVILFSLPAFFYLLYLRNNFSFLPYFQYDFGNGAGVRLWDWVLLQGPTLLLALLWFKFITFKKEGSMFFLAVFAVVNFLFYFFISGFISLNELRFLQTPLFVILGILGTEAIFKLTKKVVLICLISLICLIGSLSTIWLDFNHEVHLYYDAYYIWPPKDYFPGLRFLEKNSKPEEVVLTYQSLSNLVPMISGNTVFWGHTNETLEYAKKQTLVENFYRGLMSESEAKTFLQKNMIKYVLVGREEKNLGSFNYKFLTKTFANFELEIYNTKL